LDIYKEPLSLNDVTVMSLGHSPEICPCSD